MRLALGPVALELRWPRVLAKAAVAVTDWAPLSRWWPGSVSESFTGAWQRGRTVSVDDAASHPTLWACLTLIAGDIAKCRPRIVAVDDDGIRTERESAAYSPVLRKPNAYQNRIQFFEYWVLSKLARGNAYALKERDERGVVTRLYLLDPTRVRPCVTPSGDVYYACNQDTLAGLAEPSLLIPASEIIHDRWNALYHPLCGLSPIYACGHAAIQGLTIVANATRLFRNGFRFGGILTAPGVIGPEAAERLEKYWEQNYAGEENAGKIAVLGDGLAFQKPESMTMVDAQLIEQLKWDDEKICGALHVPPFMVGVGPLPSYNNVEALFQMYYGQCLQGLFESIELCLTEGCELKQEPRGEWYEAEFDLETLERMDPAQKMEMATKGVLGGVLSPDEARRRFNLKPVQGGGTPYLQQQNYALAALAARDAAGPPVTPAPAQPALPPAPAPPAKGLDVDWDLLEALVLPRKVA